MDLSLKDAPTDLITKFFEVLTRLPNLRTLDLLSVSDRSPVTKGLKRKCAKFPSIREMTVCVTYEDFIKSCPNLESLTFRGGLWNIRYKTMELCGAELKRVGGLGAYIHPNVMCEFLKVPSGLRQSLNELQLWYRTARSFRRSRFTVPSKMYVSTSHQQCVGVAHDEPHNSSKVGTL